MDYTYLTTGSERTVIVSRKKITFKRGVPKNFRYGTRLVALLVQALKALRKENVGDDEIRIIHELVSKETDRETLHLDVKRMPAWMRRIVKPMLSV